MNVGKNLKYSEKMRFLFEYPVFISLLSNLKKYMDRLVII